MGKSANKKDVPAVEAEGINDKTTAFGIGDRVKHKETGDEHVIVDDNDDGGFMTFNRDTSAMNQFSADDLTLLEALMAGDLDDDSDDSEEGDEAAEGI